MVPMSQINDEDIFSQSDAPFLMGDGFSAKAAREAICRACRNEGLQSKFYMRRYCFTGRDFKEWARLKMVVAAKTP